MSSHETGRGQKVNGEFLPTRWLWPSVFNTNQPTAQLGFLKICLLAEKRISQCTEHNRTTCGSSGDTRNDEPARTYCHKETKTNLKEKTVEMKLSPPPKASWWSSKILLLGGCFTWHHHHDRSDFTNIVSRNFSCYHVLWIFTKSKSLQISEKRADWTLLTMDGEGVASRP